MNIYFTQVGFPQFYNKLVADTGWNIKSSMFRPDKSQNLAAMRVSLDESNPPSWVVMILPELGEDGNANDKNDDTEIQLNNVGSFHNIFDNPMLQQGIYRGTAILSTKFNVVCQGCTVDNVVTLVDIFNG